MAEQGRRKEIRVSFTGFWFHIYADGFCLVLSDSNSVISVNQNNLRDFLLLPFFHSCHLFFGGGHSRLHLVSSAPSQPTPWTYQTEYPVKATHSSTLNSILAVILLKLKCLWDRL